MEREILFRGQRIDTKEWVYGCLVNYLPNENPRIVSCEFFGEQHQHDYKETNHEVIPETVGQFTGLTDKTGNKIFEGDILKMPFPEIYIVKFINGVFGLFRPNEEDKYSNICYWEDAEIIGNIHENK